MPRVRKPAMCACGKEFLAYSKNQVLCPECRKEADREKWRAYRARHKDDPEAQERFRLNARRSRERNREKCREACREWKRKKKEQNPEYFKVTRRAYYLANIERERARSRDRHRKRYLLAKAMHDPNAWLEVNGIKMIECPRGCF